MVIELIPAEKPGYHIEVSQPEWYDFDVHRQWHDDLIASYVLSHKRYRFPLDVGIDLDDYQSWAGVAEALKKRFDAVLVLPVFMYEHGGVVIRCADFEDKWDSGQLGLVYTTKEFIEKAFGSYDEHLMDIYEKTLRDEVDDLSAIANGEVYECRVVRDDGGDTDSDVSPIYIGYEAYKEMIKEAEYEVSRMPDIPAKVAVDE